MRIIPSPRQVISESIYAFWKQTPALSDRFQDSEEGVHQFTEYVRQAVNQRLARERSEACSKVS